MCIRDRSYQEFGVNGLLHGYSPAQSKSEELQRRVHVDQRRPGSKARELEALRCARKAQNPLAVEDEFAWDGQAQAIYTLQETPIKKVLRSARTASVVRHGKDQPPTPSNAEQPLPIAVATAIEAVQESAIDAVSDITQTAIQVAPIPEPTPAPIPEPTPAPDPSNTVLPPAPADAPEKVSEVPYADNHGWEANRLAGVFPVVMMLIGQSQWMLRLFRLFGNGWRIFMVFVFMVVKDIRSIEQMKHERRDEVGRLLGIGRFPALDGIWSWFHEAAGKHCAGVLLKEFFANQIRYGLVTARLWFTDGHLLPYTGQNKVHAAYSTQRRMPMPGQTNLVTCDEQGRVVYFDIQEGHGDLRAAQPLAPPNRRICDPTRRIAVASASGSITSRSAFNPSATQARCWASASTWSAPAASSQEPSSIGCTVPTVAGTRARTASAGAPIRTRPTTR